MRSYKKQFIWTVLFFLVFTLCWIFPYTGDDWAWGSSIGIDRWNSWFQNYSGRYVGNMIVLILTRFRFLRAAVMAVCMVGMSYMFVKISNCKHYISLFVIALQFAAPKEILRQSIVWTSGFSNYVTSITLFILYIFLITCVFSDQNRLVVKSILLFLLGYLSAMIVEHITIMQIIVGMGIVFWTWIKKWRHKSIYIFYLLGSVLGTITMFSNECYASAVAGTDGYRSIATSMSELCVKICDNYFDTIGKQMILNNIILELFAAVVVTILYMQKINEGKDQRHILEGSVVLIDVSVLYGLITRINNSWSQSYALGKYIDGFVNLVFWSALIIFTLFMTIEESKKARMLMIVFGIVCACGSLLMVSPIGPRCFFASYVLMIWYCVECLSLITINPEWKGMVLKITLMMTGLILCMNFAIYGALYKQDKQQLEMIRKAERDGNEEVVVQVFQYEDYLHCARINGIWAERYKLFYGISPDLKITYN